MVSQLGVYSLEEWRDVNPHVMWFDNSISMLQNITKNKIKKKITHSIKL